MSTRHLPVPAATFVVAALVPFVLGASATAARAQSLQRFAGDVVRLENHTLTMRTRLGQTVDLHAPDTMRVTVRVPASWSDISTGSYVGTTAVPQADGTLLAKEVHIFSDAQRGVGEGHYPFGAPGDTMTNATVSAMSTRPARDTTTNANVAATAGPAGAAHRMTLTYKDGQKVVVVPEATPIVTSQPGDRTLLAPGTHVIAYARRDTDGALAAERVSVGRDGTTPPI